MELNDPNRNRRAGFLGVAVATLLTPGGKLFTSAMAAITVAAVVSNMGPNQNPSGPSGATIDSGALEATGKMVDVSDVPAAGDTQMLSAETLVEDPTTAPGNPAAFTSQSMSLANFAGVNIASVAGGNIGGGSGPIPVFPPLIFPERENPEKAKCTVVLVGELESNPELAGDEAICLEDDQVAKKNGDLESTGGDPESTAKPAPESVGEPASEPIVIALGSPSKPEPELITPEHIGPTAEETSPANSGPMVERQLFQPLVSVAAIPEPTTLALFGLGLLGFAQVYRKNKHQN